MNHKLYYLIEETSYNTTTSPTEEIEGRKYTLLLKIKELEDILAIYRPHKKIHTLNGRILIMENKRPIEIIQDVESYVNKEAIELSKL